MNMVPEIKRKLSAVSRDFFSICIVPILSFFIFAGGEIGGVGGMFLSVPLLATTRLVLYEYGKRISDTRKNEARPFEEMTLAGDIPPRSSESGNDHQGIF
jgi:hypothetical protein